MLAFSFYQPLFGATPTKKETANYILEKLKHRGVGLYTDYKYFFSANRCKLHRRIEYDDGSGFEHTVLDLTTDQNIKVEFNNNPETGIPWYEIRVNRLLELNWTGDMIEGEYGSYYKSYENEALVENLAKAFNRLNSFCTRGK